MMPFPSSLRLLLLASCSPAAIAQSGWQQFLLLTPKPPARAYHELVYDTANARTVLFGGWGFQGVYLGDTWTWDGAVWTPALTPVAPPARLGHVMAYDSVRGRVVLHGGAVGGGNGIDADDTWEWDGFAWTQRQPAVRPPARRGACMAFDPLRGVCVLFGGGVGYTVTPMLADTWEWDGTTWLQRASPTSPPARIGACLVGDPARGNVVLLGGNFGAAIGTPRDTWTWDGVAWQQRFPQNPPPGRMDAGGAYDAQEQLVVVFGGQEMLPGQTFHDTVWVWDGVDWQEDTRSPRPPAQMAYSLAYDSARDRIVKFGGYWTAVEQATWEYQVGARSTWTPTGPGCSGPFGPPTLTPANGSRPVAGSAFTLLLSYAFGNNLSLVAFGQSDQVWGPNPLPLDLTSIGMTGCVLRTSTEFLTAFFLNAGAGSFTWAIPVTPNAIGFQFHAQAMVLDITANPYGAVLSNAASGVVGAW